MDRSRSRIFAGLVILFAAASPLHARAETGVTSDAILFGQAAALEGPSSALGQGMRQGIRAAFAEINAKGGVHGRKLHLVSRDDGYDPDRSVVQTTKLIEEDNIFALIGAVGTPTAIATVPISSARNVPFIGPFTGAEFLRAPELRSVVNIRASYSAEAEAWVKHLTEDLHFTNIAIFYQDDSFGRDGLAGVKRALDKRGMELSAEGTFERNTKFVSSALRIIKRAEPQAVVMIGTYGPCAEFIKLAHKAGFRSDLRQRLLRRRQRAGQGARRRRRRRHRFPGGAVSVGHLAQGRRRLPGGPKGPRSHLSPSFVSLEGYLSGRFAAAALELTGPDPTRAGLLRVVNEVGRFDISGSIVTVGPKMQEAPPKVFLTVIQKDGSFKAVDRL